MGICLLLAGVLHIGLLGFLELPERPSPQPRRALDLALVGPPAPVAETAVVKPPASATVVSPPASTPDPVPEPAASHPPAAPPAAVSPAPLPRPFAGKSARELALAAAATRSDVAARPPGQRVLRLPDAPGRLDFAYYLESWRRHVERVGRLNYPSEARRSKITGSLRLLVVVDADGALAHVRLVESSGHAVLDQAALRIVRLAAPYAPFPPSIRAQADRLEIERTWRFQGGTAALL